MNNAVYGKTMENLRKRSAFELIKEGDKIEKLAAQPGFVDFRIFNENLAAVHRITVEQANHHRRIDSRTI